MKIRNAIDESFLEEETESRDEMHDQWRTAGKEHGTR
jgi:hypothetical protein